MENEYIKSSNDRNFIADVIDASKEVPVLVDFWAPWCGPCRTLGPNIERVVSSHKGKVKLVKINVDENPGYAGQLRVQSIPSVFMFVDGKAVDGFMGALPESQIKAFVEKHLKADDGAGSIDQMILAAEESLKLGDIGGAAQSYAQVLQVDAQNLKALSGLARCYLKGGDFEHAEEILAQIPADKKNDPDVASIRAEYALAKGAQGSGDVSALLSKLRDNPKDYDSRFALANAYVGHGDMQAAVEALFEILKDDLDWGDKKARHQLLQIFDALGNANELTRTGRRRLSSLLFA